MIKLGFVLLAGTLAVVSMGSVAGIAPKASAASANSGINSTYNKNAKGKTSEQDPTLQDQLQNDSPADGDGTAGSNDSAGSGTTESEETSASTVEKIISAGMAYLGTPYEFGSSRSNDRTFDCSDLMRWIFREAANVTLPSDSRSQGEYVKAKGEVKTDWHDLKRGDLMFFMSYKGTKESDYSGIDKSSQRITHVGIYLGDGKMLNTYSNKSGGVTVSKIEGTHFEYRFLYGGSAL
ncbi:C40 family peptidase [Cohnella sp. AR92]|uniref:C40 family peptidase n=1 Tax=Cohnella sp. AR92 TaxID=648716 RepID=UPI001EDEA1BF|nr:C40 family peptidase [Cohnella sp. AR92]